MSLSVQQLLNDAKRLAMRLRDHDDSANRVVSNAQETLKSVVEMKTYQEDIETLNAIAHNRPRPQLVLGIQQENRHIRQLQQENKELRAALEEHQHAIELIMSKYRQHMTCMVNSTKVDKNALKQTKSKMLQERVDKICEMAAVMNRSIRLDDQAQVQEQEFMSRLMTENKGLREMLEISCRNGSYSDPLFGPRLTSRECQTEDLSGQPQAFNSSRDDVNDRLRNDAKYPKKLSNDDGETASACKHCHRAASILNSAVTVRSVSSSNDSSRPVSVASSDSDTTSEEDDEITFNTIKRHVAKKNNGIEEKVNGDHAASNGSEKENI